MFEIVKGSEERDCKCVRCDSETTSRIMTQDEVERYFKRRRKEMNTRVMNACNQHKFGYRFLTTSVLIMTDIAVWKYNYLESIVTLYHSSTEKIDRKTGEFSEFHVQFKNRLMNPESVISYIARHEEFRGKEMEKRGIEKHNPRKHRNALNGAFYTTEDDRSVSYKCKHCGYEKEFTENRVILYKIKLRELRRNVMRGKYGASAQEFFKRHTDSHFILRNCVYQCSRCGDLMEHEYLRMVCGDDSYTNRHYCEQCGTPSMHFISLGQIQAAPCPKCGESGL